MRSNKQFLFVSVIVLLAGFCSTAAAQTELPRTEIGIQVTLPIYNADGYNPETGIGGRFTYNLNKYLAVEGAVTYFPNKPDICDNGVSTCNARKYQGVGDERLLGVFGAKVGYRHNKFGLFLKARPGFIQLYKSPFNGDNTGCVFHTRREGYLICRVTDFAFDTGSVVEFYPTKRLMFRTDVGTVIIRQGDVYKTPVKGLFQVSVGVGVRF
ncbi:MAG: outer membrane beta-barrel protein [Blastocatellia bacterium]